MTTPFEHFVAYQLAWEKILDTEFALRPWASEAGVRDEEEEIRRTGREIYQRFREHGGAEWGLFGAILKLGGTGYHFVRDSDARHILQTMTQALVDDSSSEDLRDLNVALTRETDAAFYFLEEKHSATTSTYWFFGVGREALRCVVREYVFSCSHGTIDQYFERKGVWPDAAKSRALLDYRYFFSRSPKGPQWATRFALQNLPEETDGLARLLLGTSSDDALLQLATLSRLRSAIDAHGAEHTRQVNVIREMVAALVVRLEFGLLLLFVILVLVAYRVFLAR